MKKEKIYGLAYGLVLLIILIGTTVSGQYAYNDVTPGSWDITDIELSNTTVEVNTKGIEMISNHIKKELRFLKDKIEMVLKGELLLEVVIAKDGTIKSAKVIEGGNTNLNELLSDVVLDIEQVEPISYNGVPKEKSVWIPVKFNK